MRRESSKERTLGVKEATVVGARKEADGLCVEDGVGLLVHAVGNEEKRQSGADEPAVHGIEVQRPVDEQHLLVYL